MPSISEYVSSDWDPFTNEEIEAPKIGQSQGVRMVCRLKGGEELLKTERAQELSHETSA